MTDFMETEDRREIIKQKLRQNFDGKIVRKDLTKKIRKVQMFRSMCWNFCWDSIAVLMIRKLLSRAWKM